MEDPDEDWEIGEYTSSSDCLEEEEGKSNIKWILRKGLGIGKKVVITGFVISSAPLVLPSVVVVSALGFAVSVPFGVMFASYSTTQWLMNKLLPIPTLYPKLEYDNVVDYDNMVEYEEEKDGEIKYFLMQKKEIDGEIEYLVMEKGGLEVADDLTEGLEERIDLVTGENERRLGEYDDDLEDVRHDDECSNEEDVGIKYDYMEEAEKEQMEDIREGIEKRIELVENENELLREDDDFDDLKETKLEDEERLAKGGESLKEKGIEMEYVHMEGEEKEQMDDVREGIEETIELVKNENELPLEDDDDDLKEIQQEYEERSVNGEDSLKEEGYEEDIDEDLEVKNEGPEEERDVIIEGERVEGEYDSVREESKDGEQLLNVETEGERGEGERETVREENKDGQQLLDAKIEGERLKGEHEVVGEESKPAEQLVDVKTEAEGVEKEHEAVREESKDGEQMLEVKRIVVVVGGEKRNDSESLVVIARGVGREIPRDERAIDNGEGGDLKNQTVGLLEKVRDEGNVHDAAKGTRSKKKKNKRGVKKSLVEGKDNVRDVPVGREMEIPVEEENEHLDTQVHMIEEDRERNSEIQAENKFGTASSFEDENEKLQKVVEAAIESGPKNTDNEYVKVNPKKRARINGDYVESSSEKVEPSLEMEKIVLESRGAVVESNHVTENGYSVLEEKPKPEESSEVIAQQQQTGVDSGVSNPIPEKGEVVIYSSEVTREAADGNNLADQMVFEVRSNYPGNEEATNFFLEGNVDIIEIPITESIPEPVPLPRPTPDTEQSDNSSRVDSEVLSETIVVEENVNIIEISIPKPLPVPRPKPDPEQSDNSSRVVSEVLSETIVLDENVVEIAITESIPEPVPAPRPKPDPEHSDNSSRVDSEVLSEKEWIVGNKKIWEQIDALRTIVGYDATHQKSCIDELKALYIFTGVEPPSSFENTTDLEELNVKLRFLMSIVGVK